MERFLQYTGGERGLARVEILVGAGGLLVLAVLTLLIVAPKLGTFRMQSAAREFESQVQRARALAVDQMRETAVFIEPYGARVGEDRVARGRYRVAIGSSIRDSSAWDVLPVGDGDSEGIFDLSEGPHRRLGVTLELAAPLAGPAGYGIPGALVFAPTGLVLNPPSDFPSGSAGVVFRDLTAADTAPTRVVWIDRDARTSIGVGTR